MYCFEQVDLTDQTLLLFLLCLYLIVSISCKTNSKNLKQFIPGGKKVRVRIISFISCGDYVIIVNIPYFF